MKFKKLLFCLLIIVITIMPCLTVKATDSNELNIYSKGAILIDSNTGIVLYGKNSEEKMYPASTTKILTSIIAIEKCDLDAMVTVNRSAVLAIPAGYSSGYLSEGEIMSVKDLLTIFLVHSANDAGYVLAEYISESIEDFAKLMNEKAKEIGCTNSHFVNPSGIHDENHYTTAHDLSLIARYCMKNEIFRNIVSLKNCTVDATNKFGVRKYANTNDLLNTSSKYYNDKCIGIKTGYTSEAQNCLISAFSKDGVELISVILGATSLETGKSERYLDSNALCEYGFDNFSLRTISKKGDLVNTIEVANGSKDTRNLGLILENDISALMKNDAEVPEPTITLNNTISAPISKNTSLGTVSYDINGITYSSNLLAANDVEKNDFLLVILNISFGIVLALFILIFLFSKSKKRKKRKKNYIKY